MENVCTTSARRRRSMASHWRTALASSSTKSMSSTLDDGTVRRFCSDLQRQRLPWTPIARASSVRNSERSPGSPPAATLSTVPDADPAARLIDRRDAPSCVISVRTTERSSSNSLDSRRNNVPSSVLPYVEPRRCTTRMAKSAPPRWSRRYATSASRCRADADRRAGHARYAVRPAVAATAPSTSSRVSVSRAASTSPPDPTCGPSCGSRKNCGQFVQHSHTATGDRASPNSFWHCSRWRRPVLHHRQRAQRRPPPD